MSALRNRGSGKLHLLTTKQVRAAGAGDHSDGGGLYLRVRGASASWVFRYTAKSGKRREMGIGPAYRDSDKEAGASLTAARDAAHRARDLLRRGVDPIDTRDAERAAARQADEQRKAEKARERWTLARAAREYHERAVEPKRTAKHAAQWISSLENHIPAELWHAPIDSITPVQLLDALRQVRPHERARNVRGDTVPETLQRIRQRLDSVFEDAIFHGRCTSNPATAIKRKMREQLPGKEAGKFAALPYREAPVLMRRLRAMEGVAARALEFGVLCVARTGEVLGARWDEIHDLDGDEPTWVLPPARMKAKEAHTVYLSPRAVEIVKAMHGLDPALVFPSPMPSREGKPLSNMALLAVLDRLGVRAQTTVHGLCRATFSTWANETGAARPDVTEACLAHREGDRVRAAYNRAQFAEERAALLRAWADYLTREPATVTALNSRRAA